jgi:hypothetical protein
MLTVVAVVVLVLSALLSATGHSLRADGFLSQTPQQPDFSSFDLLDIPAPSYNLTPTSLPSKCANFTMPAPAGDTSNIECPSSMIGYFVYYEDCTAPFPICHCITANITIIEAADHLARVPVGLRRNIDTVMILPSAFETSSAYTLGHDIHFFGVCSQKTWVHEVSISC